MKVVTYNVRFIGFGSADIARERLLTIVRRDRETCPAWRWVPVSVRRVVNWNSGASMCDLLLRALKPAFRWERRR